MIHALYALQETVVVVISKLKYWFYVEALVEVNSQSCLYCVCDSVGTFMFAERSYSMELCVIYYLSCLG